MRIEGTGRRNGFVPVELLAIITMVFLLATIAAPAVGRLKLQTLTTRCLNNHRELAHAFQLYATDNDGKCANNFTLPSTLGAIQNGQLNNWANNVMTWGASGSVEDRSVTNVALAATSTLFPYTEGDISVFSCPADVYISPVQKSRGYKRRVRSISMNSLIGMAENVLSAGSGRSWGWGGQYRQWLKVSDIVNPASTFLTIDEHPDSLNDGFFITDSSTQYWGDYPGTLHGNGTSFSFTDGHVEFHPWRGRSARVKVNFGYQFPQRTDEGTRKDLKWYNDHVGLVRY